jgi:DUF3011 family protein
MTLSKIKLGTFARYATHTVAALMAVFFIGGGLSHATPQRDAVRCSSDNGGRNYCNADTRGGVRLVRKLSDAPCIAGRTWGFDRRGIWVDRGCRAEFVTGTETDSGRGGYGRGGRGRAFSQTFYCESGDERRHYCSEGALGRGEVRLIRQRSGSPCIFGRTWGRDRSGVWVDRGCRADFEVSR